MLNYLKPSKRAASANRRARRRKPPPPPSCSSSPGTAVAMPPLQTLSPLSSLPFSLSHRHREAAPRSRPIRGARARPIASVSVSADAATAGRVSLDAGGAPEPEPPREEGVPGIHVPRQRYISVPKADLLDAILSTFDSEEEAKEFARFARCLDSVLHAEHKVLLEEMRKCHAVTCFHESEEAGQPSRSWSQPTQDGFVNDGTSLNIYNQLDITNIFREPLIGASKISLHMSRVSAGTRFQQAFMKLLRDAKFEEISAQDLILTLALNKDYLLRLPIYVDWKKALQSNAIIFRRGYTAEKQKGMLLVEKMDYLQSRLLQRMFSLFSEPVKKIGCRINEAFKQSSRTEENQDWIKKAKAWLVEPYLPQNMLLYFENRYNSLLEIKDSDNILPIWLAAQRAVPLYEGLLSSVGPRGRLIRKLLAWIGFIPSLPEMPLKFDGDNDHSEPYLRPTFLHRVTLSDIWKPATKEFCGNNLWKRFKAGVSILFSESYLQEPAFQELILLYTEDQGNKKSDDRDKVLPLKLKIYEKIPVPDLPVIFPHKKLSFRILDTIRLDIASILGLLAFFVNYKFETVISSPSAFLLDLIAIGALIIFASRVALGYKQTWDRYQLLVNKTLYEKTIASGFGSVHFLLDASEQQRYKEAILAYAILLSQKDQKNCYENIKDACERLLYTKFKKTVEMPIESAIETLLKLEIVTDHSSKELGIFEIFPSSKACNALKDHWDTLLAENQ